MNASDRHRTLAIVVTFHPDAASLTPLLQALSAQVEKILVVDNTPGEAPSALVQAKESIHGIDVRSQGRNTGIAAAQNVGIRVALEEGYDYILLSDQDSLPAPDMVSKLLACNAALAANGVSVGCVCPEYFDLTSKQTFGFQVPGKFFYRSMTADPASPWLEVIAAISSGSLIPRAAIEAVGGMREEFFIDHVDTEWCHRARAMGFRNFGTAQAKLTHSLGDEPLSAWYFGWGEHSEYSPTRLYYRFRNFILMCRLSHVPRRWCVRASWYWLGNLYAHCLFGKRRLASARAIGLGLWHGFLGRSGPAGRKI